MAIANNTRIPTYRAEIEGKGFFYSFTDIKKGFLSLFAAGRAHIVLGAPDLAGNEMCDTSGVVFLHLATHQQHQLRQPLLHRRTYTLLMLASQKYIQWNLR